MPRVLIVEDDQSMRALLREHLGYAYEIVETAAASEALALALQSKPDCILLDLRLPESSGFELCRTLSSLNATRLIPIFVITSEPAAKYKEFCLNLGAKEYFEKPVDFTHLAVRLAAVVQDGRIDRRIELRVPLTAVLRLQGRDVTGEQFDLLTATDDVSASGFLCNCPMPLAKDSIVEVFLTGTGERYIGRARVVRVQWCDTPRQRYGFRFVEKSDVWIL